mmetsp:Transcript_12909/g.24573  ORF Transcript_12909/g.24573 Transcript_12909/m.24573 type:complete len:412 (-) Transcript_12909:277-1512(-)|eukprot:CAMPEP_0114258852 /NCGR_PEP_ID=MMETSP0058-20121206/19564_1 /TAXON_ID=36894 /ORGANISM="Pyramimonas parkeae, CCMP726" /LENGTH=411 /DNA_ID=CAMNT_0001373827 /DNA_START=376 /DNA_END=1611 /DNA_ORIENTATION=-
MSCYSFHDAYLTKIKSNRLTLHKQHTRFSHEYKRGPLLAKCNRCLVRAQTSPSKEDSRDTSTVIRHATWKTFECPSSSVAPSVGKDLERKIARRERTRAHGVHSAYIGQDMSTRLLRNRGYDKPLMQAGPTTPKPTYSSTPLDRLLLSFFHFTLSSVVGDKYRGGGYAAMIRTTRLLSTKYESADLTQKKANTVFKRLLPSGFAEAFGLFCDLFPDWFVARHAASVVPLGLAWLVGPARVVDAPTEVAMDNCERVPANVWDSIFKVGDAKLLQDQGYRQGVLVERCRVLEESGCASVCLNVCKVPTQDFFNNEVGLPMTMIPNYETFECQFVFGASPPPAQEDEAFDTACFKQCPTAQARQTQCHHLSWGSNDEAFESGLVLKPEIIMGGDARSDSDMSKDADGLTKKPTN